MAVETTWYVRDRVVYQRISGTLDIDTLQRMNREYQALAAQGKPPIHLVADFEPLEHLDVTLHELTKITSLDVGPGWMIVERGSSPTLNKLIDLFTNLGGHIFNIKLTVVDDRAQVHEFLARQDASLSGMLPPA